VPWCLSMTEGSVLSSIIFIAFEVNFLNLRASLHLWWIISVVASTHSLQSFYFLGSVFFQSCIAWFQKISISLPRVVLPIRPPHPLGISVPEGSCITPHPPGISYFPFHGLYLLHLEIIDRAPLKINCSHLNLWPVCNLLQGNLYFLRR